jgi:hypothetical protein
MLSDHDRGSWHMHIAYMHDDGDVPRKSRSKGIKVVAALHREALAHPAPCCLLLGTFLIYSKALHIAYCIIVSLYIIAMLMLILIGNLDKLDLDYGWLYEWVDLQYTVRMNVVPHASSSYSGQIHRAS